MSIYDTLNDKQAEAVLHDRGPLLILAGAGSGKTRVLTHRIAYLIEERDVEPYRIMAITFTNKAAKEMRERIDKIVSYGAKNIWVSTFHSSCVRILRQHIELLGYDKSFTIYDTDDQKSIMRDICKHLDIDNKRYKERTLLSAISSAKNELITPERYEKEAGIDFTLKLYAKVYTEYQKRLKINNALDFDDLLVKTVELLETNQHVLFAYQNRFRYILVDEYQDTNTAQFKFISLLATGVSEYGEIEHNLCVVGDDDQSIYKFRGANIRNILDFESTYKDAFVIKLEQNYRSTKNVLEAANAVISHNKGRKEKKLWTDNEAGEPVKFYYYDTDREEASNTIEDIFNKKLSLNISYDDFAILYRTNAQSRAFEEKLVMKGIPYKIVGSINFYQRKEIKDLLCYLKTIDNGMDAIAVKRIINVPRRGIGTASIDKVESYALRNDISFYNALCHVEQIDGLSRSAAKITSFVSFIESMKSRLMTKGYSLKNLLEEIIELTGYVKEIEEGEPDEAVDRIGNINELISKITAYEAEASDVPTLSGFLEETALVADIDSLDEGGEKVVLMTLHSAKGLEFPYVYLCGMEDGIFPSYMALDAEQPELEIEEERRLCYVGITRAMKHLCLSAAKQRMLRGVFQSNKISMFINEIPRYLLKYEIASKVTSISFDDENEQSFKKGNEPVKPKPFLKPYIATPKQFGSSEIGSLDYAVGDTVIHTKFGIGIVKEIIRGGKDYEVTVEFETMGVKKMLSSFAKLSKIN